MIELYALEVDVLAFGLSSPRAFGTVLENLGRDYKFVTDQHNWIFDQVKEDYITRGEIPSAAVLALRAGESTDLRSAVEKIQDHKLSSPKVAIEELRNVSLLGRIQGAIEEVKPKLRAKDAKAARDIFSRLVLGTDRREGIQVINYYEDFAERQEVRRKAGTPASIRIKTMISPIDEATGGLVPGDLFLVCGVTSIGKTYFTASHIGFNAISLGWGGIHFTLEDSAQSISNRYDARLFKIPKPRLSVHDISEEEEDHMKRTLARRKELANRLQIVGMAAGSCGVETIKRFIIERRAAGALVDFVIIDSPDHMPPIRKREQMRFEIKETFQALKDLGTEFSIPVIATTHMPKEFEGKIARKRGVTAESYDKMRIASKAITLNHSSEMLPDELVVVLVKNRDGKSKIEIPMVVDYDTGTYRVLRKPIGTDEEDERGYESELD
jgi:replicative DNA helicase